MLLYCQGNPDRSPFLSCKGKEEKIAFSSFQYHRFHSSTHYRMETMIKVFQRNWGWQKLGLPQMVRRLLSSDQMSTWDEFIHIHPSLEKGHGKTIQHATWETRPTCNPELRSLDTWSTLQFFPVENFGFSTQYKMCAWGNTTNLSWVVQVLDQPLQL